jgi:hypothetical protein
MISAFGVDHGEISKARLPRLPNGKRMTRAQRATRGVNPNAKPRGQQASDFLNRVGDAHVSLKGIGNTAGKGAAGVGNFMAGHPGLTGTAVIGGAGAGGYKYLSDKEPKTKKKV